MYSDTCKIMFHFEVKFVLALSAYGSKCCAVFVNTLTFFDKSNKRLLDGLSGSDGKQSEPPLDISKT